MFFTTKWYAIFGLSFIEQKLNTLGEGWWGFQLGDTIRNKQQTTSLADVNPVWRLFDSNVRLVGRLFFLHYKDGAGSKPAGGNY